MSSPDAASMKNDYLVEKQTGFDASLYTGRDETFSRHGTRILDPRSALTRITTSIDQRPTFTHPLSQQKTEKDVIIKFDSPNDPYRPLNWPARKKVITILLYGLTTTCSSWGTSMYDTWADILPCHKLIFPTYTSVIGAVGDEYHVSNIVSTLGVTLFLFGHVASCL